jgi:hypothetical protein
MTYWFYELPREGTRCLERMVVMPTVAERKSAAIAKALVKALVRIEADTMNDVEMTIDDLRIEAFHKSAGVKAVVEALAKYYLGNESDS